MKLWKRMIASLIVAAMLVNSLPASRLMPEVKQANNVIAASADNSAHWPLAISTGLKKEGTDWPKYASSGNYHSGTDLSAPEGTEIYATYRGTVATKKSMTSSYGKHIVIKSNVRGSTVYIYYCHMSGFAKGISVGDSIKAGQLIGYVGQTGNATGSHLHYEVRNSNRRYGSVSSPTLNPWSYLPSSKEASASSGTSKSSKKSAAQNSYNYDPDKALAFAKEHCASDGRLGYDNTGRCQFGWQCAEFVCQSLKHGGFNKTKEFSTYAMTLGTNLQKYGTTYTCHTKIGSAVKIKDIGNGHHKASEFKGAIMIDYKSGKTSGQGGHVQIMTGTINPDGTMLSYTHNNMHKNAAKFWREKGGKMIVVVLNGAPSSSSSVSGEGKPVNVKTTIAKPAPKINYKVSLGKETDITNYSVKFNLNINYKAPVKKIGIFYGRDKSDIQAIPAEPTEVDTKYHEYKLLEEYQPIKDRKSYSFNTKTDYTHSKQKIVDLEKGSTGLKCNTKYYYKMRVLIDGEWYITELGSFKTLNEKPEKVPGLTVASGTKDIGVNEKAEITWKKADRADYYVVTVTNPSGKVIKSKKTEGKQYTTPKLGSKDAGGDGTYTVAVVAHNDAGDSASKSVKVNVHPDAIVSFDFGYYKSGSKEKTVTYNHSVQTPKAKREGFTFSGWKKDGGKLIAASQKINNVKENAVYVAQWNVRKAKIRFVDGITGKTINTIEKPFGETVSSSEYPSKDKIPEHKDYEWAGWSENLYTVGTLETHTIYARYKWTSDYEFNIDIKEVTRTLNNDGKTLGYNVTVDVTAPVGNQSIKGRVVVALKNKEGRLLLETESAAFAALLKTDSQTKQTIKVFVPYESGDEGDLPTSTEAYVVNNYYTAGMISNVDIDTEKTAEQKYTLDNPKYTTETVAKDKVIKNGDTVGIVVSSKDKTEYKKKVVTTKRSINTNIGSDYILNTKNDKWVWTNTAQNFYVKDSDRPVGYYLDKGTGKTLYAKYAKKKLENKEEQNWKQVSKDEEVWGYIYFHWCRGYDTGNLSHVVKDKKMTTENGTYKYYTFETFYCGKTKYNSSTDTYTYENSNYNFSKENYKGQTYWKATNTAAQKESKDSYYWFRFPVYHQNAKEYVLTHTFTKTVETTVTSLGSDSTKNLSNAEFTVTNRLKKTDGFYDAKGSVTNYTISLEGQKEVTTYNKNGVKKYAYVPKESTDVTKSYEIAGQLSDEDKKLCLAKQAKGQYPILYIYKDIQVSDYTTEYIGTAEIANDGTVKMSDVRLREACTEQTGDYSIALAIPGESSAVILQNKDSKGALTDSKIKFERPANYQLTFQVSNPASIQTEQNDETEVADYLIMDKTVTAPAGEQYEFPEEEIPEITGYHFVAWDQPLNSIDEDMVVKAIYEKNEYAVAFVDWENRSIELKKYEYGTTFEAPELPETNNDTEAKWIVGDGSDENAPSIEEYFNNKAQEAEESGKPKESAGISEDMVVSVRYTAKPVEITVVDAKDMLLMDNPEESSDVESMMQEGNIQYTSLNLEYGDIIQVDDYEPEESDDILFMGWKNAATREFIEDIEATDDMTIYPVYEFEETVAAPAADIPSGEYQEAQTVSLSTETENAVIYYTTDGTNPETSSGAIEYTEPVTISKSGTLNFVAMASGMNNSEVVTENYAINSADAAGDYHLVTIYASLPYEDMNEYQMLVKDSTALKTNELENVEGYIFEGLYHDEEFKDQFYTDSEVVTESMSLYAKYSAKQFTATFLDKDGNKELAKVTVDYAETATPPEAPEIAGYRFIGWDSDEYECLMEDKTFTARYVEEDQYATVKLNKNEVNSQVGKTFRLIPTVTPYSLSDTGLSWESDDISVAQVDDDGMVTMLSTGTAHVTVTVDATGESDQCTFTVARNADMQIALGKKSYLDIDEDGYVRRVSDKKNTVGELKEQFTNDTLIWQDNQENALKDDARAGTGTIILLKDGENELDRVVVVLTGDFNEDGLVNNKDVSMISQYVSDKREAQDYCQMLAADVNGDGYVNAKDAAVLSRYLMGKEKLAY